MSATWSEVEAVLDAVLAVAPPARAELARTLCAGNETLLGEVSSLLAAHERAGGFLGGDVAAYAPALVTAAAPRAADEPGRLIGRWRLLAEIGRGGMGTVWLAERADGQFEQRVALKLVRRGMDSDDVLARFLRERRILARLADPHIARLLDGDIAEDGRPFFVMEHVAGTRITDYCQARSLDIRRRLELFLVVCRAVQHAHRNLVVHSDLKPSNVLVTDAGDVKLVDFGIATLLADEGGEPVTRAGIARTALTPEYAAPEQVRGESASTATDVYQLGVLLYELLTDRRPYELRQRTLLELQRVVCDTDVLRPSALAPDPQRRRLLRGDLDAIVQRALRKAPEHRYSSVEALAADVEANLAGRPVQAREHAVAYVTGRFLRRHRVPVIATSTLLVIIAAFFAVYTLRMRAERDQVRLEAEKAQRSSELLDRFFQNWGPRGTVGDRGAALALVDGEARRLDLTDNEPPEVRAAAASLLGQLYLELGELDRAERLLERAAAAQRRARPATTPDLATTTTRLGVLAQRRGRYAIAERLFRAANALWASVPDAADARRSDASWELANQLFADRRYDEAAAEARRLVAPYDGQAVVPSRVAAGRRLLAVSLFNLGRLAEAERLLRATLAGWARTSPDDDDALQAQRTLSSVLRDEGRLPEAEAMARDVVRRCERKYGRGDGRTQVPSVVLAIVLEREGRFAAAETLLREAQRFFASSRVPADVLSPLMNLACVRLDQGDLAESERLLRRNREIRRRLYTGRDADDGDALNRMAYILLRRGDAAAPAAYRAAVAFHRTRPPGEALFVTDGLHYLAWSMRRMGDSAAAEAVFRQALALYRRTLPAGHPYLGETLAGLGGVLAQERRCAEAAPLLAESVASWAQRAAVAPGGLTAEEQGSRDEAAAALAGCRPATHRSASR